MGNVRDVNTEFDAIKKAFDDEVAGLTNVVHPSNWHALENALSVPLNANHG